MHVDRTSFDGLPQNKGNIQDRGRDGCRGARGVFALLFAEPDTKYITSIDLTKIIFPQPNTGKHLNE